jgi:hypothetical protein
VDKAILLKKLKDLWDTKWLLEKNGPNSKPGAEWLAEVRAHLQIAGPILAAEFAHYMQYVGLRLSSHMLGPIWINMQGILRTAVASLEASLPPEQEKIYGPGDALDLYRDLSELVATAADEVFIVDPYADQEVFDLYLEKVTTKTRIRLIEFLSGYLD